MGWTLIKQTLPRGLYGRAALILIVPIVTLQLVVSIAFLQRHFEDVTRQLTAGVALDLQFLLATAPQERASVAAMLGLSLDEGPGPAQDLLAFYDLSGRVVITALRAALPEVTHVDLSSDDRMVAVGLAPASGPLVVQVDRRRVSASNPHQLLVLMVLVAGLMTGIAYLFMRMQLRPIRRLAAAAEAFGKGQAVDYRPSGATEVRSAGRAFMDMRARIERQIEQRTLMLSGVSHDLRTPLTRMKLGLSMLDQNAETEALMRDVSEMEELLNTFLDFARADALDDPVPVDLLALVGEVVSNAGRLGGVVETRLPQSVPLIPLRPHAVRRALSNLVSNALRYGDRARITLRIQAHSVRLCVEDDGPGIAAEHRADAIRPFIRLDAARNQNKGSGVGLGLAIANDIARSHGGTLTLSNSADLGGLKVDMVLAR